MAKLTGERLADYAKGKVGTPYFYGMKMEKLTKTKANALSKAYPKVVTASYIAKAEAKKQFNRINTDCSGLISSYTGKNLGSAQLYAQAYARMPISTWKDWAPGVVVWKEGHVGVYLGNGKVAEAKGIDYGTIISDITKTKWQYGLTFSWIDYTINRPVASNTITYKSANPWAKPTRNLKKGMTGNDVKWLQWELREAGYTIAIDGIFGKDTDKILRKFQKSAKLVDDGICGPKTRKALI